MISRSQVRNLLLLEAVNVFLSLALHSQLRVASPTVLAQVDTKEQLNGVQTNPGPQLVVWLSAQALQAERQGACATRDILEF